MSIKTDRPQVRTAQDLERKYDLSAFADVTKNIKQTEEGLIRVQNEINSFINAVVPNLQSQIDGKIETFYYDGVPTLNNLPASGWNDYSVHIGDLYYDKKTGISYIFEYDEYEEIYVWNEVDNNMSEVLSIANAAQDTADSKRQIFYKVIYPNPPYDSGDLWITNDNIIYVCQISKTDGDTYEIGDFINSLDYETGTNAKKTKDALVVLSGKVTTITSNTFKKDEVEQILEGSGFHYVLTSDSIYQDGVEYYKYISLYDENGNLNQDGDTYKLLIVGTDYQIGDLIIGKIYVKENLSVQKVNHMYGTFDINGMTYEKDGAKTKSNINETGMKVSSNSDEELLFAGYVNDNRFGNLYNGKSIVYTKNLISKGYTTISDVARMEAYSDTFNNQIVKGLGVFII